MIMRAMRADREDLLAVEHKQHFRFADAADELAGARQLGMGDALGKIGEFLAWRVVHLIPRFKRPMQNASRALDSSRPAPIHGEASVRERRPRLRLQTGFREGLEARSALLGVARQDALSRAPFDAETGRLAEFDRAAIRLAAHLASGGEVFCELILAGRRQAREREKNAEEHRLMQQIDRETVAAKPSEGARAACALCRPRATPSAWIAPGNFAKATPASTPPDQGRSG